MGESVIKVQYQPYFCEENVWHLTERISGEVFVISNADKAVALWSQKLAEAASKAVIWDYHVVLAFEGLIYDLDSKLPFPCPIAKYFEHTFRPEAPDHDAEFRPRFRTIGADEYRARFHSDRGHMKNEGGEWLACPPAWPLIVNDTADALTLMKLIDFKDEASGNLRTLTQMMAMIYRNTGCG